MELLLLFSSGVQLFFVLLMVYKLSFLQGAFCEEEIQLKRKKRETLPTIEEVRTLQSKLSCIKVKFSHEDTNISFRLDDVTDHTAILYSYLTEEKNDIVETRFLFLIRNKNKKWITFTIDGSGNINFDHDSRYHTLDEALPMEDAMKFEDMQKTIKALGLFSHCTNTGNF